MFRCLFRDVCLPWRLPLTMEPHLLKLSLLTLCRTTVGSFEYSTLQYGHSRIMGLFTPVYKHSGIVNLIASRDQRSSPTPVSILLAAFFGLFGGGSDDDDDPTKVPPSVKRYLLKAHRYRRSGAYQRAERACHQALEILATSKHSSSQIYTEARAYVLDTMANIYLEQGKLMEAEVSFKETMRIMLSAGMEQESEAIIEISLKLSKIYSNQKKYEVAAVGFLWCVEKARERWEKAKSPESHALLGMCLHGLGQYHLMVGEHREAGKAFSEAVNIAREVYGEDDIQVAVMQNDLGTALDGEGRYREAEEIVRQSLATATLNKNSPEIGEYLAIIQCNLAEIQSNQGNRKAAMEMCSKAMAAGRRTGDKLLLEIIKKRCSKLS